MDNQIHVAITIPPEYVVRRRDEFEELVKQSEVPIKAWWTFADVRDATIYDTNEIVYDLISYPPYKKEIEALGAWYSTKKGEPHSFPAKAMKEWLDANHYRIRKEHNLWRKKGR